MPSLRRLRDEGVRGGLVFVVQEQCDDVETVDLDGGVEGTSVLVKRRWNREAGVLGEEELYQLDIDSGRLLEKECQWMEGQAG